MSEYIVFKSTLQKFVRSINNGSKGSTPCGQAISPTVAHALMEIGKRHEEIVNQGDLVNLLSIDKSNVARLCKSLEENDWLKRKKHLSDKRQVVISLTPKGYSLFLKIEYSSNKFIEKVFEDFTVSDQKKLITLLKRFTEVSLQFQKEI